MSVPYDTRHWRTRLIAPAVRPRGDFHALAPAVHRGSTVAFDRPAWCPWRPAVRIEIARDLLAGLGVDVQTYAPDADIAPLLRDSTVLVWCESPGSLTMEVPDVPAIVAALERA